MEFKDHSKTIRPLDIPTNPHDFYKDEGWISWVNWLGTGAIGYKNHEWLPFKDARKFARSLKLNSGKE